MKYYNKKTEIYYLSILNKKLSTKQKATVISVFSGAGGLDVGLEMAGFKTIACVENDINCRETLRYNRPEWKLFESSFKFRNGTKTKREPGDIRAIEVKELLEFAGTRPGEVTLVAGGVPCQPFSNIGKRQGQLDKENGDLFLEFIRIVKGIKPKAFLFENVAGITQEKHGDVLEYLVDNFRGMGYGISYSVLNAANYGVPQRRERFFLIGIKGIENPAFPLPTHFKDEKCWSEFVKDLDKAPRYKPKPWITLKEVLAKIPSNYEKRDDFAVMKLSSLVIERMKHIKQGNNFKALPMELRPNCWKNGKHQGNDTFGRLIESLPSVTIRTAAYNPAKGMYIHPRENRGLNTLEMAAIQGFPHAWKFRCFGRERITLVSGGKQIGNAVPPHLGKALGQAISEQIVNN